ncbi:MAG TPA: VOC family protein [Puia sp.]|nr:VOC family protein [Puia sp.]
MSTLTERAQFAPELVLKIVAPAVEYYQKAFGATVVRLFNNDDGSIHVAELSIGGSLFHLHEEMPGSPQRRSPETLGGTSVLLGIFLDDSDPDHMMASALVAGGKQVSAMQDYFYGYRQGIVADPFGHQWMIQKKI